jgi:hypothetical protein
LRSIQKSKGDSLKIFGKNIELTCEKAADIPKLAKQVALIVKSTRDLLKFAKNDLEMLQTCAREFSYSLYRLFTGKLYIKNIK